LAVRNSEPDSSDEIQSAETRRKIFDKMPGSVKLLMKERKRKIIGKRKFFSRYILVCIQDFAEKKVSIYEYKDNLKESMNGDIGRLPYAGMSAVQVLAV
jgi:hypothetical protein